MNQKVYLETLKRELKPALGCTEPIAISLACAKAKQYLTGPVHNIELTLSGNVIKNAMGVGIPGTDMIGIKPAVLLAILGGDADSGLKVLAGLTETNIKDCKDLLSVENMLVTKYTGPKKLYIAAKLISQTDHVTVVIEDYHDKITTIEKNGEVLFTLQEETVMASSLSTSNKMSVAEIYEFATTVNVEDIEFLMLGVELNILLAKDGLKEQRGLGIGKSLQSRVDKGILSDDIKNHSMINSAAAVDSRMGGSPLTAMSNSGSGDQGITAIVPVYSAWSRLALSKEQLYRALVISNLIPIHIKQSLGRLSALCGVTIASIGVSAGLAYLYGADLEQINKAINNNIASLSGLFCDGAKNSCSLKVATAIDAAFTSTFCALDDIGVTGLEGIIDDDVEKSITNLANLASVSMTRVDEDILDIMIKKAH